MNWKLNYWTVLFALAVAAFAYHHFVNEIPESSPNKMDRTCHAVSSCDTSSADYHISDSIAFSRIIKYSSAMLNIQKVLDSVDYKLPVTNLLMSFAKLPRCEMYDMLCDIPDGDVYIFPTIEEATDRSGNTVSLFSIVLGDTPYISGSPISGMEQFFDFATPCPPCDPKR